MRATSAVVLFLLQPCLVVGLACGSGSSVTGPTSEPDTSSRASAPKSETWIVWGQSNALGCAEGPGAVGGPGVEAWAHGA